MRIDTALFLLFLGVIAVVQAMMPGRGRVVALLCASLIFYAVSSVSYLILLLGLCGLNYWAALSLSQNLDQRRRTWVFTGTVLVNLAVLIFFKYAADVITQGMLRWNGHAPAAEAGFAVPLGISYFTFQMLACVTDAYRQTWRIDHGFTNFVLFGLFFPQISSGPIPRAGPLLPQLVGGDLPVVEDRLEGVRLIAFGFFKKYVVANRINEYVTDVFKDQFGTGTLAALIGCCLNALQIYADFSGYVDIAIGSALFFGIRLAPNFDRPFLSTSVTEFWRRWHMTLSFWLRDYLYLPLLIRIRILGKSGVVLAIIITFAVCGIWHGLTWTFLLFGIAQGLALSAEILTKSWRTKRLKRLPENVVRWSGRFYTLGFFALSQVLFRAANVPQALWIYGRLIHLNFSGGLAQLFAARPFFFALDCVAIGSWVGVAYFHRRATSRSTPWFVFLCGLLIIFLGRLGSAHFIYAKF
ncbi:MAG: rane bound O-acyl transferase family protein [Pedosphaera sp.]|nr:rane bound O-acyl transferase family protein [Pedosphaera sp.]